MFPAHAGMNRQDHCFRHNFWYVPRTRGDEPISDSNNGLGGLCSPHTRG